LGQDWLLLETIYKRHAACIYTHAAIEACLKLRNRKDFSIADVESVTVGTL